MSATAEPQVLAGIGACPGRASGVVVVLPDAVPEPPAGATPIAAGAMLVDGAGPEWRR